MSQPQESITERDVIRLVSFEVGYPHDAKNRLEDDSNTSTWSTECVISLITDWDNGLFRYW